MDNEELVLGAVIGGGVLAWLNHAVKHTSKKRERMLRSSLHSLELTELGLLNDEENTGLFTRARRKRADVDNVPAVVNDLYSAFLRNLLPIGALVGSFLVTDNWLDSRRRQQLRREARRAQDDLDRLLTSAWQLAAYKRRLKDAGVDIGKVFTDSAQTAADAFGKYVVQPVSYVTGAFWPFSLKGTMGLWTLVMFSLAMMYGMERQGLKLRGGNDPSAIDTTDELVSRRVADPQELASFSVRLPPRDRRPKTRKAIEQEAPNTTKSGVTLEELFKQV